MFIFLLFHVIVDIWMNIRKQSTKFEDTHILGSLDKVLDEGSLKILSDYIHVGTFLVTHTDMYTDRVPMSALYQ
jgi:hypothetical protein